MVKKLPEIDLGLSNHQIALQLVQIVENESYDALLKAELIADTLGKRICSNSDLFFLISISCSTPRFLQQGSGRRQLGSSQWSASAKYPIKKQVFNYLHTLFSFV